MRLAPVRVALAIVLAAASAARADEPSRPGALLDVPFVAQTEALCGGASVAMVQRYWGAREVSAADFASLVDVATEWHPGVATRRRGPAAGLAGFRLERDAGSHPASRRERAPDHRPASGGTEPATLRRRRLVERRPRAVPRSGQPSLQDTLSCCVRQAVGADVEMDVAAPASPGADDSRANDGSFSARVRVGAD